MFDSGLKVGSVVTLKSGGQRMTVGAVTMDGDVHCVWNNDQNGDLRERSFRSEVLTCVEAGANVYDFTARRAESAPTPQIERSAEEFATPIPEPDLRQQAFAEPVEGSVLYGGAASGL